MHYSSYREYLDHRLFRVMRAVAMTKAGRLCLHCDSPATEVHHKRYPTWGAFDVPENLQPICHACHCKIHGKAS